MHLCDKQLVTDTLSFGPPPNFRICARVLQCVAVCCRVLQCRTHTRTSCGPPPIFRIWVCVLNGLHCVELCWSVAHTHAHTHTHVCRAVRRRIPECGHVYCCVLQCVAVCCSVLQCVAVCCSVLQCVAVCCSVARTHIYRAVRRRGSEFPHVRCSVVQCHHFIHTHMHTSCEQPPDLCTGEFVSDVQKLGEFCRVEFGNVCCNVLQCIAVCCSVMQCDAVCCSVLQCVAVCCSVLQCVAACCSVLQFVAV